MSDVSAALTQALQPLVDRLERIEAHLEDKSFVARPRNSHVHGNNVSTSGRLRIQSAEEMDWLLPATDALQAWQTKRASIDSLSSKCGTRRTRTSSLDWLLPGLDESKACRGSKEPKAHRGSKESKGSASNTNALASTGRARERSVDGPSTSATSKGKVRRMSNPHLGFHLFRARRSSVEAADSSADNDRSTTSSLQVAAAARRISSESDRPSVLSEVKGDKTRKEDEQPPVTIEHCTAAGIEPASCAILASSTPASWTIPTPIKPMSTCRCRLGGVSHGPVHLCIRHGLPMAVCALSPARPHTSSSLSQTTALIPCAVVEQVMMRGVAELRRCARDATILDHGTSGLGSHPSPHAMPAPARTRNTSPYLLPHAKSCRASHA